MGDCSNIEMAVMSRSKMDSSKDMYFTDQTSVSSTLGSSNDEDHIKPSNIHVFSSSSTLHGFSHIFATHHSALRRFFWTVAFFTSLTLFLYQSSNRIVYYNSYPHVTRLDEVTAGNLNFPAVTICNLNEFRFNKITQNDMYHAGKLLGFLDQNDTLLKPTFYTEIQTLQEPTRTRMKQIKDRIDFLTSFDGVNFNAKAKFNMFEFYNRTGHNISQFLLDCKYRGEICNSTWFSENKGETNKQDLKPSDFRHFASNSTFHGVAHIIPSGRTTVRNVLWGILFFLSLGFFLDQAYNRYCYFMTYPHVTKLDEMEATEMNFPAVTICNVNSFRFNALTTDDFFYTGQSLIKLFDEKYELGHHGPIDSKTWSKLEQKIGPILKKKNSYRPSSKTFNTFEFYNRTGHILYKMVKKCLYRGFDCKRQDDWTVVFTRYGKCYTFNSGKKYDPLKTLKGGVDNGLELLLDTEQNEYMPVWAETDEISIEAGFKVQIHVQEEPPFIHELGFGVSPGFQTLVTTQEQQITFLPYPYGKCVAEADKSRHYHFDNYSISACRITCETDYVVDNCNCRMVHMPGNASYCTPEDYKNCADEILDYLLKNDETRCLCGTPCKVTRYNLEMSSLKLPSTQALSYLSYKYGKSEEYIQNNFVKLNVFFEALNYETIDQKRAYEIPGLFGDIGGQMGLFIGASILTILELFDYIYEVIKDKVWARIQRKKQKKSAQEKAIQEATQNEDCHYTSQLSNCTSGSKLIDPVSCSGHFSSFQLPEAHECIPYTGPSFTVPERRDRANIPPQYPGIFYNPRATDSKQQHQFSPPPPPSFSLSFSSSCKDHASISYPNLYKPPDASRSLLDSSRNANALQCAPSGYSERAPSRASTSDSYIRCRMQKSKSNGKLQQPVGMSQNLLEIQDCIETDIN